MDVPEAVRRADPDPGDEPAPDEEPDARPEGPAPSADPDPGDDDLPELEESEESAWSVWDWLTDTPEGSYRDADARDYWDPENGGSNRLAFHLGDLVGARGVPNWLGLSIGAAETYYQLAQRSGGGGDGGGGGDDSGGGFPEIQESGPV